MNSNQKVDGPPNLVGGLYIQSNEDFSLNKDDKSITKASYIHVAERRIVLSKHLYVIVILVHAYSRGHCELHIRNSL